MARPLNYLLFIREMAALIACGYAVLNAADDIISFGRTGHVTREYT